MELTSRMKMARFQTFWIQMRKNKPLNESRKTGQTSGSKMAFYSNENKQKDMNLNGVILIFKALIFFMARSPQRNHFLLQ
ncbi:hypothetical protein Hanom_Chr16g01426831 [Helianthus anomalus]